MSYERPGAYQEAPTDDFELLGGSGYGLGWARCAGSDGGYASRSAASNSSPPGDRATGSAASGTAVSASAITVAGMVMWSPSEGLSQKVHRCDVEIYRFLGLDCVQREDLVMWRTTS